MTTVTCPPHHWLLEDGNEADGVCKFCGAQRHFKGGEPAPWEVPVLMSRTAKPRNRGLRYAAEQEAM